MKKLIILSFFLMSNFSFAANSFVKTIVLQADNMEEIYEKCEDIEKLVKSVAFDMSSNLGILDIDESRNYRENVKAIVENVSVLNRWHGDVYTAGCVVRNLK